MWIRCKKKGSDGGGNVEITLNVECSFEFAGKTVTCSRNGTTLQQTCPSSAPYIVSFTVNEFGPWTLSSVISGQTVTTIYTVSDTMNTTFDLGTPPDGKTVTPVNNVTLLLNCAEIFTKNYTTINQLLSDSSALTTVISSNNAVDYLVRSTDFATAMTGNESAMTLIGNNDYCSATLLQNSDWSSAIVSSSYYALVLNYQVPKMTSNTVPSGTVYSNSVLNSNYAAYKAFDRTLGSEGDSERWVSAQNVKGKSAYLSYMFVSKALCKKIKVHATFNGSVEKSIASNLHFEGSNDNSTWTSLFTKSMTTTEMSSDSIYDIPNNTYYKYYRIYFDDFNIVGTANDKYVQCRTLQLYCRAQVS